VATAPLNSVPSVAVTGTPVALLIGSSTETLIDAAFSAASKLK
jgi:hypothetical protein